MATKHHKSIITSIKTKNINIAIHQSDGTCKDVSWPTQYAINSLGLETELWWCKNTHTWHTKPCDCYDAPWNDALKVHGIKTTFAKDRVLIESKGCPRLRTVIQRRAEDGRLAFASTSGKLKHFIQHAASIAYHAEYIDNAIDFNKLLRSAFSRFENRITLEESIKHLNSLPSHI